MENMIQRIIDADNKAKALEEKTLREREELNKSIDTDAQKIYDKYMSAAEDTVKKNNEAEKKKAEQMWADIQQKHEDILKKLKSDYESNNDKWADEIVKRTIEAQ